MVDESSENQRVSASGVCPIISTCLWAAVSPATIGALVIGKIAIPSVVLIVIFAIEAGKNLLKQ